MADFGFEGSLDRTLLQPNTPRLVKSKLLPSPIRVENALERLAALEEQVEQQAQLLEVFHFDQQKALADAHDRVTGRSNELLQTSDITERDAAGIENRLHFSVGAFQPFAGLFFDDGAGWAYCAPFAVQMFIPDATNQVVSNTITETTVFTGTLPATAMSNDGFLRFTSFLEYTNNTGASQALDIRMRHEGALFGRIKFDAVAPNVLFRSVVVHSHVANLNATNLQLGHTEALLGNALGTTPNSSGISDHRIAYDNGGAVDTTLDSDITMTVQHSVASANLSVTFRTGHIELAP